ncbi:MAG: hypothetical protein EA380_04860 [Phycisphaeraceae bacterium]|nr:MAG: hypothetical protein EA380_04860 [Phycisphaeraceae bacterium]
MTRSAAKRRTRYTVLALILFSALTLGAAFAVALGTRYHTRLDLTATREHTLSPRTIETLSKLDADHTLVISARFQQIDQRALQRIRDLLDAFTQASPRISFREINLNSPAALDQAEAVVRLSLQNHSDAAQRHTDALTRASEALEGIAERTDEIAALAQSLVQRQQPGEFRRTWNDNASAAAALPPLAREAAEILRAHREMPILAEVRLPQVDAALTAIEPTLTTIDVTLAGIMTLCQQTLRTAASEDAALARQMLSGAERARDDALRTRDALGALDPLDPLSVARVLEAQEAVLILGPAQTTAVDFQSLLPRRLEDAGGTRLRMAGESLISAAIAASANPVQPVLILVHAEPTNLMRSSGRLSQGAENQIGMLVGRLRQQRVRVHEWPVLLSPRPPDRSTLQIADRETPIVWFVLGAPGGGQLGERIERRDRLSTAILRLVEAGESILLTVGPSELPAIGDTDPLVEALPLFGITSDSGRLLIRRASTPQGPAPAVDFTLRRSTGEHPIARALDALPTYLRAATPLRPDDQPPDGASVWPVLAIPASADTWAMAAWQSLLRQGMTRLPNPDPMRDDVEGPWPIVVAAERTPPDTARDDSKQQRLVAVAAAAWFTDATTQAASQVDGIVTRRFPGNDELFDASFAWLAGLDDQIGAGPSVRDVPRIADLSDAQILAMRWALIAGLPVLVLLSGLAFRWLRG